MKESIKENHTLYAVKAYLPKRQESIQIGKLGSFAFEKGYYVYVGSAKRNIRSRVNRHITVEKKQRWHLDYLRPYLKIEEIQTYSGEEGECQLFARLQEKNTGNIPVKGFGSSDCKCSAHLFYTSTESIL
ncbi:GIY-YIG nuclease family protein [Tetragenococcus halophilus]|uniref:GIY-YIG nuclease family protein n=1 Tax=Tetragenococcus halophilus TaxID=51669 RepID=UPI001F16E2B8|nr:GIY-YIG nuclease family protein [Tetragenococcus halophilus]MCF1685858.1 GIY-YIG nuclease family protein [Tetragenococcus halophilus]